MSENKLHYYFEGFGRDYTQCAQSLILTLKSRITSSSNKGTVGVPMFNSSWPQLPDPRYYLSGAIDVTMNIQLLNYI